MVILLLKKFGVAFSQNIGGTNSCQVNKNARLFRNQGANINERNIILRLDFISKIF